MSVVWTRKALRRLEEIHDYIAVDAPRRADAFCDRLVAATEQLRLHLLSGPLLPEDAAYRQLVIDGYRIVYRVADWEVYVMTVVSPGMLASNALSGTDAHASRSGY